MDALVRGLLAGETRAAARACRLVDDRAPGHRDLLKTLYPHSGTAWVLGVTGNPGAGKSTLTSRLIEHFRNEGGRVAVLAVDPTSPFSGGAILGDRIRMQQHFEDPEVFIRSVATRGALGGLSRSALDLALVLDAWGARVILVETVGVGQDELDIVRAARTTLVVVPPGLGDDIQAIKAGILECADVLAVNKADRPGADATVRDLENMIALGQMSLAPPAPGHGHSAASVRLTPGAAAEGDWVCPIVKTVATDGQGVSELVDQLRRHRDWTDSTAAGRARLRERARARLVAMLREDLAAEVGARLGEQIEEAAGKVAGGLEDPYTASERLVEAFGRS